MKIDIQKIKKQLGFPSDRPLTLQEKRRYMKFAVYPLFFLIFTGIVLLIYSPTEKEKAEAEKERGFNTEIPSPEESRMEGNKVSAYEREALSKKERGKTRSWKCRNCSTGTRTGKTPYRQWIAE